jgi:hypothetical protein
MVATGVDGTRLEPSIDGGSPSLHGINLEYQMRKRAAIEELSSQYRYSARGHFH